MGNGTTRRLASMAALIMAATAVSRVLGLVREQVMVYYLGLGADMGAFTVAFKAPSLVWTMVSDTALSAAFIPVFSELLVKGRRQEAWRVATTVSFVALLVLGTLSLLGVVFARQVMWLMAPGYSDPATIGLAVDLTRIMFPLVLLLGLAAIAMGILNSYDHFTLPALGPIAWNVVIIASITFFARSHGFYALAWGVVAGTTVQLAMQLPLVARLREPGGIALDLRNPAVRRVGALLWPVVLSLGLVNVNWFVNTIFASFISEPAPAVIDKAFRLFQLPQGVFAIAIGTVLLPSLSRLAASKLMPEFKGALTSGLRQVFFLTLPFTVFFLVLGQPTVRLIYQHGRFTAADTDAVTWALYFFSLGMAFVSANTLLSRGFYGIQKTWPPLVVGCVNLGLNVLLNYLLYRPLGVGGITMATSAVTLVNFLGLYWLLRRDVGSLGGRRLLEGIGKSLAACAPLALAAFGSWWLLDHWLGRSNGAQVVSVGAGYVLGLGAYVLAARVLRIEEMNLVTDVLRRLRRGFGRGDSEVPGVGP